MRVRIGSPLLGVMLVWLAALGAAAEGDDPVAEARAAIEPVFARIVSAARSEELTPEQKLALVEADLDRWLDFAFLSVAALGPAAKSFTPEQLAEYSHEFERYVSDVYIRRIIRYRDNDVEIEGARYDEKSGRVTIQTLGGASLAVTGRANRRNWKERAPVDYVLRERHGQWRIVALRIDGVDMARFFGDQFRAVVEREGPDALIAVLRERNAERSQHNPFEKVP